MTKLEASVRDQVALFVEGYITADRLNDVLPDTWEIDESNDASLVALTMRVIGHLAEYQSGAVFEEEVRSALAVDASWTINREFLSTVTTQQGLDAQVHAAVDTPLLVGSL